MARSPSQMAVIGVDLGTSGVKAVVARDGTLLASAHSPLIVSNPEPGWSEQHPEDWVGAARQAITDAVSKSGLPKEHIAGIGLSGQMHGAVVLDSAHQPLRPAILWNDNRAVAECAALTDAIPDIGQIAGIVPLPGFTAPKLMWLRSNEPEVFGQTRTILLPKDYLALWMTGEIGTDRSDAAGTLWLDQKAREWSAAVVYDTGIDPSMLPALRDGSDRVGYLRDSVAEQLGLVAGLPVFAGGGDAATGALALGAASAGKCFMSLGTSGQLLMVDDAYRPDPARYIHDYCHTLPGLWYRMAAMLNGARPLAWFAGVLGVEVPEMLHLSEQADPNRIPLFLPYLTGERSPHGDPNIRGGFYGLEDATGRGEMARAVVEAVAFSMGDAKASFGAAFEPAGPIPAIGGGSRGNAVLRAIASVIGHPVARAEVGDGGAAMGAAYLAELGAGMREPGSLVFDPPVSQVWEPEADEALLVRFARYQALYQALKGTRPNPA